MQKAKSVLSKKEQKELEGEEFLSKQAGKLTEQISNVRHQLRQLEIAHSDIERQHNLLEDQLGQHHQRIEEYKQVAADAEEQVLSIVDALDTLAETASGFSLGGG